MNLYNNYEKDGELKMRIGTGDSFSYEELTTFQRDGLLENFDLFGVSSDFPKDIFIYYHDGNYYLIKRKKTTQMIDPQLLTNRRFTVASQSITNNVQHYIQLHGTDALDGVSKTELIKIIMGKNYEEPKELELKDLRDAFDEER